MRGDKDFSIWQTSIAVRGDKEISHPTFLRMLDMMRNRGFVIGSDPRIDRDYSILSKDHFAGNKGELLFVGEKYNCGAKLEFYQEINVENPNGGRYDFNKFEKMSYLLQKRFLVEVRYMEQFLLEEGFTCDSKPVLKTSYDKVFHELNSPSRHWSSENLPDYNALDKDGIRINNGEVKYFRGRKGTLMRGTVYHNINNMWWVIVNKDHYTNLAAFELFNLDTVPENAIRKLIRRSGHNNPKSRFVPTEGQLKDWKRKAKQAGREGRIQFANAILGYLYEIGWVSRKFQLFIKETKRLGLVETEGNPYFLGMRVGEKKYDPPKSIPLYPKPQQMSGTESGWVENLRDYVTYGKPTVSRWFCKDQNGEGGQAHLWPEVRERLLHIGAHV
ncbi:MULTISPECIES: hypothetical protein [Paenibacillus]|uniref:hypothetical protein n=1 Tax=Paenibacillus TaxID=44249 RepID=UPI0020254F5C|nr:MULTISPECIES: hypothetical protein [Paenibacillus]MCP3778766.1 hypothetical protein [Paenibacillus sp. MZ03-122A]URJ42269.1 hypothetical protein MF627_001931 [Paenibacillus polymyxa]